MHDEQLTIREVTARGCGCGVDDAQALAAADYPLDAMLTEAARHLAADATLAADDIDASVVFMSGYRAAFLHELMLHVTVRLAAASMPEILTLPTTAAWTL